MPSPEVRAAFLKSALASFEALPPPRAAGAWARLPGGTVAAVRAAGRLDWLPARHALEILAAIEAEAGDDGVRLCSLAAIEATLEAPLLRGFVEAALATLSPSPHTLLRAVAHAWPLHYRDAGELAFPGAQVERCVRVLHVGIPEPLLAPRWLLSMATCLGRVAALVAPGARGEPARDGAKVSYLVRW